MINSSNKETPFYFFTFGIILLVAAPQLLSRGMFSDGLLYSTIAHNLANGIGSFWNPQVNQISPTAFHSHPPLAFGIQSLFYRILGGAIILDKIYSLSTFLLVGVLLNKILQLLAVKHRWIAFLFWLLTPVVTWSMGNNMLENTLTVFTTLSVFFYLKSRTSNECLFIILSGFTLSLGFLSKGFVAFFPLVFPFLFGVFKKENSFKIFLQTIILFISSILPLLLLYLLIPAAKIYFNNYLEVQVIYSLEKMVDVDSRFFILKRLFLGELIVSYLLICIVLLWGKIKLKSVSKTRSISKEGYLFFSLALCGVLPIMISMKQSGFYILPTYIFFAISFTLFLQPVLEKLIAYVNSNSSGFVIFKRFSFGIFALAIGVNIYFTTQYSRDEIKIKDIEKIIAVIPEKSIINMDSELSKDWSLQSYFQRFKGIALETITENNERDYFITNKETIKGINEDNYTIKQLRTEEYFLFERKTKGY